MATGKNDMRMREILLSCDRINIPEELKSTVNRNNQWDIINHF